MLNTINLPANSTPVFLAEFPTTSVPEPASSALLAFALAAVGAARRWRSSRR